MDDLQQMTDTAFLAECRRVRDELASQEKPSIDLIVKGQRLSDELVRRAKEAWAVTGKQSRR